MSALFVLIGISILVAGGFLVAFLWSARSGQYDDDYTPSVRMLFDDTPKISKTIKENPAIQSEKTINSKKKSKVICK